MIFGKKKKKIWTSGFFYWQIIDQTVKLTIEKINNQTVKLTIENMTVFVWSIFTLNVASITFYSFFKLFNANKQYTVR